MKRVLDEQQKLNRLLDQSSLEIEKLHSQAKLSHKKIVEAENLIESLERNLRVAESLLREKDEQLNELSEALVISKVEYKALLEKVEEEGSPNQPRRISLFLEGQKPLQNVTVGTQDTSMFLAGMEMETLGVVKMLDGVQSSMNKSSHKDDGSDDSRLRESNSEPCQVIISHFHKYELKQCKWKADKSIETLDLGLKKLRRNSSPGQNIDLGQVIQYIEMSKDVSEQAGTGLKRQVLLADAAKRVMRKLGSTASNDQSLDSISSFPENDLKEDQAQASESKKSVVPQSGNGEGKNARIFAGINLKIPGLRRADSEEWTEIESGLMVGHSSSTTALPEIGNQAKRQTQSMNAQSGVGQIQEIEQQPKSSKVPGVVRFPTFAAKEPLIIPESGVTPPGMQAGIRTSNSERSDLHRLQGSQLNFSKHPKPIPEVSASSECTSLTASLSASRVSLVTSTPSAAGQSKASPLRSPTKDPTAQRRSQEEFRMEAVGVEQVVVGHALQNVPEWQRVTAKFGPQGSPRTSPRIIRMESIPVEEAEVAAFSRALRKFTATSKSRSPPLRVSRTDSRGKLAEIKGGVMSERSRDRILIPKKQIISTAQVSVKSGKLPSPRTKSVAKSQGWSFSAMDHDPEPQETRSGATTFRSEITQEDQIQSQRAQLPFDQRRVSIDVSSIRRPKTKSREHSRDMNKPKSPFLNVELREPSGNSKSPSMRPRTSTNSDIRPMSALEMRKLSGYDLR